MRNQAEMKIAKYGNEEIEVWKWAALLSHSTSRNIVAIKERTRQQRIFLRMYMTTTASRPQLEVSVPG